VPPLRRLFKTFFKSVKTSVSAGISSGGRGTTAGRSTVKGGAQLSQLAPRSRNDEEDATWTRLDDDRTSTNSGSGQEATGGATIKPVIFQETTITIEARNAETGSIDHRYRG
jgi:hypothetical protein